MNSIPRQMLESLGRHWFVPAAVLVLSGCIVATQTADWSTEAALLEGALLFDLAILLPILFWACYRLDAKAAVLRSVAIACGGIWLASHLVPSEHQSLLPSVAFLRYGAIAVLIYIEVRIMAALYWAVVSGRVPPEQAAAHLSREAGVPAPLAALMAREAQFWQRVLAKPLAFVRKFLPRREQS